MLEPKAERIYQARRDAHLARLRDVGLPEDEAETAIVEWEALATAEGRQRGSSAFWDGLDEWAATRRGY